MLIGRNGFGNDSFCKLLLRGDALTDASPSGRTITNASAVSVVTDTDFPGGKALNFPGADFAYASSSSDFSFGSGPFSVELRVKPTANGAVDGMLQLDNVTTFYAPLSIWISEGYLQWGLSNNGTSFNVWDMSLSTIPAPPLNVVTAIELNRHGDTLRMFKNGAVVASTTLASGTTVGPSTLEFVVGRIQVFGTPRPFTGRMTCRISKGNGRRSRPYTVPNRAY